MTLLAIDPGTTRSAGVKIDAETCKPLESFLLDNDKALEAVRILHYDLVVIERMESFGKSVGASVLITCEWIGHFARVALDRGLPVRYVTRRQEKMTLIGRMAASDTDVRNALIERFAPGVESLGKGSKAAPGWFYGFKADVWQAYAVGVTWLDKRREAAP